MDILGQDALAASTVVRQSTLGVSESKFLAFDSTISLNFHGVYSPDAAFEHSPQLVEATAKSEDVGILLEIWSASSCSMDLSVSLDLYGSLGQLIKRFITAHLVFPFVIALWIFGKQIKEWTHSGKFPSCRLQYRDETNFIG
jgi:hypothetical protein